ncbi:hypothetical protein GHT06_017134 [Daphnia sinensis]|uniref:Uncharacterized protein n=1 Tax=Daphnia sinensis TaxID=1820382 RepID=A0AAD5L754_9CRUS|nr:hypothetical protein GHT06_017134 [Daphnia sinensis]
MAEDIATLTIDQCKSRQKLLRKKITGCCTRIRKVITSSLSRREATRLLEDARTLLGESGPINDRLLELLEDAEGEQQQELFLRYGGDVDAVADEVAAYLSSREGDVASVIGWDPIDPEVIAAQQRAQEAARIYEEAARAAQAALREMEAAKRSTQDLGLGKDFNGDREDDFQSIASVHLYQSVPRVHAPDEWINDYCIRVDLEVYSGRALDWFEWIDLFHSLVHQTGKTPGEKLAILKRNVKGETADLVYGLGGGELSYKESLHRLKGTCGSRAVIRAAHLQALDRVEPPTPATFRRFAEKVRTHLFNLTWIGEAGHADLIERLTQKLQPHDRLHWNDGQRGGLERRTMNEFGLWLCTHAAAYQNAYSIAAEQHQRNNNSTRPSQTAHSPYHQKRHSRAHLASTNHRAGPARGASAPTTREGMTPVPKPPYSDAASTHLDSEEVTLQLRTAFGSMVTLRGSTLKTVTQPVPVYNWEQLRHQWTHLHDLPPLRSSGGRIGILIGLNYTTLITPTDYRLGADDEPAAIKTRLGWTILGVIGPGPTARALCHRAFASSDVHITAELVNQVRRFCDTDSFGTTALGCPQTIDVQSRGWTPKPGSWMWGIRHRYSGRMTSLHCYPTTGV